MSEDTALVVGLGNPGPQYEKTRHNVGFMVAGVLSARMGGKFSAHKKSGAEIVQGRLEGRPTILAKPRSFMNLSGSAVAGLARFFSVDPGNIVVIHDELDLDFGTIRLKQGGGEGGHNGLRSISSALGTKEYLRTRVGIGRPPRTDGSGVVRAEAVLLGGTQGTRPRLRRIRGCRRAGPARRARGCAEPPALGAPRLVDQIHRRGAAEFARRRLGNAAGPEDGDRARSHADLGEHGVHDLVLDALDHFGVLIVVGLHRDGETFPLLPRVEADGHRVAGTYSGDGAGGPLDVRRVDVAATHDDDVLDAAAHDDEAFFGEVADVAGVQPAVRVLRGLVSVDRDVSGG